MDNIEFFNRAVAEILRVLYAQFPRPVPRLIYLEITAYAGLPERDTPLASAQEVGAAVEWLQTEGFIRCASLNPHGFAHNVVLTAKGLAALQLVPKSLSAKKTNGELLFELGKSASKDAFNAAVSALVAAAMAAGQS